MKKDEKTYVLLDMNKPLGTNYIVFLCFSKINSGPVENHALQLLELSVVFRFFGNSQRTYALSRLHVNHVDLKKPFYHVSRRAQ